MKEQNPINKIEEKIYRISFNHEYTKVYMKEEGMLNSVMLYEERD